MGGVSQAGPRDRASDGRVFHGDAYAAVIVLAELYEPSYVTSSLDRLSPSVCRTEGRKAAHTVRLLGCVANRKPGLRLGSGRDG